mgnify:CR=1 FL=1
MKLAEIIGGMVLLVSATAGTITWSDLRYALRLDTQEKIAGIAAQYQQQREDSTERMIFELEREKARKGKLSDFEEREYRRLLRERQRIREEIQRLLRENK